MTGLEIVIAIVLSLAMLIMFFGLISGICLPPPQFEPMSYDDEMDWLMNRHGLTYDEADEIARLPSRYH